MTSEFLTNRDDFEYWLSSMDEFLEQMLEVFPESDQHRLDYSPESLDVVENWVLSKYKKIDDILVPSESQLANCIACYVGETFRKKLGAKWDIRFDDPSFAYHALPILTWGKESDCPLTIVTAAIDRRTGKFFRTLLENA
ncbi:hypothetical protein AB1K70_24665 [Bremerella sp. JC770]|uniref:hypothetical protein n=1 Tax=Bremerella sp. JC770 TaxID=3232137 RepID=UPI0034583337